MKITNDSDIYMYIYTPHVNSSRALMSVYTRERKISEREREKRRAHLLSFWGEKAVYLGELHIFFLTYKLLSFWYVMSACNVCILPILFNAVCAAFIRGRGQEDDLNMRLLVC